MDKWINDYGYELLDGVFMDETMSVYENQSLKQLYFDSIEYIRNKFSVGGKNALIVGNAGQAAPIDLIQAFDSIVIFEQPMRNFDLETCPKYDINTVYCGMSEHPELTSMLQERANV